MEKQVRMFQDGEIVYAGYQKLKMKIISAEQCLEGWRYRLGFMTKMGFIHKTRTHRHFFEKDLIKK